MKRLLAVVTVLAFCVSASAQQKSIDGTWLGNLSFNNITVRVVFNITKTPSGYSATVDSPDQGAKGIPASSTTQQGDAVEIDVKNIGGNFKGKLSGDLNSMEGMWSQGGVQLPLLLKRTTEPIAVLRRPQEPVKPYPYREEDVTFANNTAGIKLAGTLTLPPTNGPYTAVVLITGSGPQNRDLEVFGHRPFLVLADHLTRKGIAVLRVDDRGVGASTGDFEAATTADFATDVEAAVAYLKGRPEIDKRRIGLIGLSEGGIIAPMVAVRNPDVAFVVMMAGTGVPGAQVLPEQVKALVLASGASAEKAEEQAQHMREEINTGSRFNSPWMRYFLTYDPAPTLRKLKCPILAMAGSLDKQVIPAQNLPVIRQSLQQAGNRHFEVVEIPGLNHLFQSAKSGSEAEYAQIVETMSPIAMQTIANWIARN